MDPGCKTIMLLKTTEGEAGSSGLNSTGTAFPWPTAHDMPITPDEYQEMIPQGYPGEIGVKIAFPDFQHTGFDQMEQELRATPVESMSKSREWRIWLEWFLELQGSERDVFTRRESGWEWVARQAFVRRTLHTSRRGRLIWPSRSGVPSPELTTTVPIVRQGWSGTPSIRVVLGRFARGVNWDRRCRRVIKERKIVKDKTHAIWLAWEASSYSKEEKDTSEAEMGPSPIGLPRVLGPPRPPPNTCLGAGRYLPPIPELSASLHERQEYTWVRPFSDMLDERVSHEARGIDVVAVDYDVLAPRARSTGELAALGLNSAGTGFTSPTAHAAMDEDVVCTSDRYQVIETLIEGNNHKAYLLGILHARLAEAKERAAEAEERAAAMKLDEEFRASRRRRRGISPATHRVPRAERTTSVERFRRRQVLGYQDLTSDWRERVTLTPRLVLRERSRSRSWVARPRAADSAGAVPATSAEGGSGASS